MASEGESGGDSAVDYLDGRALKEMAPSPLRHGTQVVGADGLTPLPIPGMKKGGPGGLGPLPPPLPLGELSTPPHRAEGGGGGGVGGMPQPRREGKPTLLPLTSL